MITGIVLKPAGKITIKIIILKLENGHCHYNLQVSNDNGDCIKPCRSIMITVIICDRSTLHVGSCVSPEKLVG